VGWGAWGGGSERHLSSSTTLAAGGKAAGVSSHNPGMAVIKAEPKEVSRAIDPTWLS
jgi:hypothetical protein